MKLTPFVEIQRGHSFHVGTSVPPFSATQEEILGFILEHFPIASDTKTMYKKTHRNKSIFKRHFGVQLLTDALEKDLTKINERFKNWAVPLSAESLQRALHHAALRASDVDYLVAATCTGYLCPGLTSYVIESCGLRSDVRIADAVGMGCGAAMPALELAHNFLAANPGSTAAIVCTEICSAAFFSNDDKDIVISNTLFADGSAALILKSTEQIKGFSTVIKPEWRDALRFRTQDGYLKNVLSEDVPEKAAAAVNEAVTNLLEKHNLTRDEIDHWVIHAGGEKIIQALQKEFQLSDDAVQSSVNVLKNYGNISSPSVLFVLKEEIERKNPKPGAFGVMTSFGAGFSAHAALIEF